MANGYCPDCNHWEGHSPGCLFVKAQRRQAETIKILQDWLHFAADVRPGCPASADWLDTLRARTIDTLKGLGND